ncbi:signal recognition particle SRP19 subunit [Crucibulum laeve]|uniref:Signal recognition particle SRP19 subunit n=1 Tax=Crucibulum laeve TaxID=68775 RepID=A0A5C3MKG3_9AGAR|nr:signal recognition particle SRP19 subunit [Crucibulum laeve]
MSRKPTVVEEFDDDTDLPLPSHPLPNLGTHGPLIQELHISDDEFEPSQLAGPASPPRQQYPPRTPVPPTENGSRRDNNTVTDITPYKTWTCIYPIYLDAKRPYGTGQRRVERAKSLWWPLSKDIADAANRLGLGTLHEVNKAHPRDWENPGRVRVQWKKDGRLLNPMIKTKKQLLEMLCFQIQHLKPENIPKPPYNTSPKEEIVVPSKSISTGASAKGKQPASIKSKSPAAPQPKQTGGRRLPIPPEPQPPLASRVSPYSPALSSGVLIETVKAGMNATETPAVGGAPPGTPGGLQKGKRKVVRVRG